MQDQLLARSNITQVRAPKRVLVAEDDDDFRALVALALRADGYLVEAVPDGATLVARLRDPEIAPHLALVVSDVRMGGLTGLDVLASTSPEARPPVLLMTAFASDALVRTALDLGAAAVISKPFELDDLRTVASMLVARPRAVRRETP